MHSGLSPFSLAKHDSTRNTTETSELLSTTFICWWVSTRLKQDDDEKEEEEKSNVKKRQQILVYFAIRWNKVNDKQKTKMATAKETRNYFYCSEQWCELCVPSCSNPQWSKSERNEHLDCPVNTLCRDKGSKAKRRDTMAMPH